MEALLEKEADVESWNDERMDELSRRMDAGFKETRESFATVHQEMKKGFARVDAQLAELATRKEVQAVDDRIFMLICSLLVLIGGIIGTLIVVNG